MIVLDTSVLVDALSGPRGSAPALRRAIERGERVLLPSLVLYEWLRGPRQAEKVAAQEALFRASVALPFGPAESARAAHLYVALPRLGSTRPAESPRHGTTCARPSGGYTPGVQVPEPVPAPGGHR